MAESLPNHFFRLYNGQISVHKLLVEALLKGVSQSATMLRILPPLCRQDQVLGHLSLVDNPKWLQVSGGTLASSHPEKDSLQVYTWGLPPTRCLPTKGLRPYGQVFVAGCVAMLDPALACPECSGSAHHPHPAGVSTSLTFNATSPSLTFSFFIKKGTLPLQRKEKANYANRFCHSWVAKSHEQESRLSNKIQ